MDISAQSIFAGNDYSRVFGLDNRIACHATELTVCEQLMSMGYKTSCGTNIEKRAEWLTSEIHRLEELLKAKKRQTK